MPVARQRNSLRLLSLALAALLAACGPRPAPPAASPDPPPADGLAVSFLDIGQGDAALVRFPDGGAWLVDGGPPGSAERLEEALAEAGIAAGELRAVVASHPHADHIGGFLELLPRFPPAQALDSGFIHATATFRTYLETVRDVGAAFHRLQAGEELEPAAGVRVEVLAPSEPFIEGTASDANNNSLVLRLTYGEARFLFTGDLETEGRQRIYDSRQAEWLPAEVLKVAHHGSFNGTDEEFLSRVRPEIAVLSCRAGNEYGHPHREALEALEAAGVQLYRTDLHGTVTVSTDGRTLAASMEHPPGEERLPDPIPTPPGGWIGNERSRVYHHPDCVSLPDPVRRVPLATADLAHAEGFRAHGACVR